MVFMLFLLQLMRSESKKQTEFNTKGLDEHKEDGKELGEDEDQAVNEEEDVRGREDRSRD